MLPGFIIFSLIILKLINTHKSYENCEYPNNKENTAEEVKYCTNMTAINPKVLKCLTTEVGNSLFKSHLCLTLSD